MTFHESEPTPVEVDDDLTLAIETALHENEHGDLVSYYENYATAKEALLEKVRELMCGEGDSIDENLGHVKDLLINMSQSYAHTVLEFNHEDRPEIAARLVQRTASEFEKLAADGIHENDPNLSDKLDENVHENLVDLLENEDDDEAFELLENAMGTSIATIIENDLPDVPANQNESKKEHKDLIKSQAIEFTKDVAKIGLGTLAAGIIMRKFKSK